MRHVIYILDKDSLLGRQWEALFIASMVKSSSDVFIGGPDNR